MMKSLKANSIGKRSYDKLSPEEQQSEHRIVRGILHINEQRTEYTRLYERVIEEARGNQA